MLGVESIALLFLLIVTIIIGVITSYTDSKKGIIPNVLVFSGIIIAIVINFFIPQFNSTLEFWANLFFAFLFGFILYMANLWSAGDAKLYIAFAALIPVEFYFFNYLPFFPSFTILINTFAPVFVYHLFRLMKDTSWADKIEALKKSTQPKATGKLVVALFVISWVIDFIFRITGLPVNLLIAALIIFVLFEFIGGVLKIDEFKFSLIVGALILIFDFQSILRPFFWQFFVILLATFVFLRFFVLHLGMKAYGTKVPIAQLKPGMVPLDIVIEREGYYKIRSAFYPTLFQIIDDSIENFVVTMGPKGLSKKDVQNLNKWHSELNLSEKELTIQESIPFAPFLFLGVLITLAIRNDIVFYLVGLI